MIANNDVGGTSPKNMVHWTQMMAADKIQLYDYGLDGNIEHYGSESPPLYKLETLKERLANVPIMLLRGDEDPLVTDLGF